MADLQPTTKIKYKREIENLVRSGVNPLDLNELTNYANGLKSSRKSFLKSALRLMSSGHKQGLKSSATPENIAQVQASVYRLEAMQDAIQIKSRKGTKAHIWLSPKQVEEITQLCRNDLEGRRDWIVLGLLLGAGLRREEAATLTFGALKQQPTKDGNVRDVLQVKGKGAKDRVIPINATLARRLREWKEEVGDGNIARSLGMGKVVGESMSAVAIFQLVQKYGEKIGVPELAPHDCRRSFAQIGLDAGVPITQISVLLGHNNVSTTQKYLNLSLDLETTASDYVPLSGD